MCIKAILFFSFWQGVLIAILAYFNVLPESAGAWTKDNIARGLQDLIICIEMALLAVANSYVFSSAPYGQITILKSWEESPKVVIAQPLKNFAHVISQEDIVTELRHVYNPKNIESAKALHDNIKRKYREKQASELLGDFEIVETVKLANPVQTPNYATIVETVPLVNPAQTPNYATIVETVPLANPAQTPNYATINKV
jgi:hypothetical protein